MSIWLPDSTAVAESNEHEKQLDNLYQTLFSKSELQLEPETILKLIEDATQIYNDKLDADRKRKYQEQAEKVKLLAELAAMKCSKASMSVWDDRQVIEMKTNTSLFNFIDLYWNGFLAKCRLELKRLIHQVHLKIDKTVSMLSWNIDLSLEQLYSQLEASETEASRAFDELILKKIRLDSLEQAPNESVESYANQIWAYVSSILDKSYDFDSVVDSIWKYNQFEPTFLARLNPDLTQKLEQILVFVNLQKRGIDAAARRVLAQTIDIKPIEARLFSKAGKPLEPEEARKLLESYVYLCDNIIGGQAKLTQNYELAKFYHLPLDESVCNGDQVRRFYSNPPPEVYTNLLTYYNHYNHLYSERCLEFLNDKFYHLKYTSGPAIQIVEAIVGDNYQGIKWVPKLQVDKNRIIEVMAQQLDRTLIKLRGLEREAQLDTLKEILDTLHYEMCAKLHEFEANFKPFEGLIEFEPTSNKKLGWPVVSFLTCRELCPFMENMQDRDLLDILSRLLKSSDLTEQTFAGRHSKLWENRAVSF